MAVRAAVRDDKVRDTTDYTVDDLVFASGGDPADGQAHVSGPGRPGTSVHADDEGFALSAG